MNQAANPSDSRAYSAFKRVRNRLRKNYPEDIVLACISRMMRPDASSIEEMRRYQPWFLFLLIKWTLLYGEFLSPRRRRLELRDFNYLVNLMHDLNSAVRQPSEYDNIFLFLRNVAFQQFWLQEVLAAPRLSRQSIMFGHLVQSHPFGSEFFDQIGITIEDFIQLGIILLTRFFDPQSQVFVTEGWFTSVEQGYGADTVQSFLVAVSLDLDSVQRYLKELESTPHSVSYQFYEQTPLKRYPLLKHDGKYFCYSRNLLFHALQTFVYDTLRSKDPGAFMQKFGKDIFEQYVERSLSYIGVPFLTEKKLRNHLGEDGKLVDFLLVDDDMHVFVDAKGVEMGYLGMVSHRPEVIQDKTKSSILKGIAQGYDTARRLSNIQHIGGLSVGAKDNYLLVITFKDLYVGSGQDFYEYIAKEDEIVKEYGNRHWIPFENMYFLSIDDLDLFAQCIRAGKVGLAEGLRKAVEADKHPSTKRFVFRQHVFEVCPDGKVPRYLEDEFISISDHIKSRMT
jgi:hypothetical protein